MQTIRGSTETCLKHYLAQLPEATNREGAAARQPIMAYCGCSSDTVRRWIRGTMPVGMMRIRARYFLSTIGYEVEELLKLAPSIHTLGKLIADDTLNREQVMQRLGYQDEHAILEILHGNRLPTEDRLTLIEQMVADQPTAPDHSSNNHASQPDTVLTSRPHRTEFNGKQLTLETAARLIKSLQPLAAAMRSDPFTEEDRAVLRGIADNRTLARLANDLFGLCRREDQAAVREILRRAD